MSGELYDCGQFRSCSGRKRYGMMIRTGDPSCQALPGSAHPELEIRTIPISLKDEAKLFLLGTES
jgi:hypothetical protein